MASGRRFRSEEKHAHPARFVVKKFSPLFAALTIAALLAGCGGGSGVRFSDLFDESAAAEGTGIQGFALVRAVVILATHEATPRQRQIAEQNGRRAVAKLKARQASASAAHKPKHKKAVVTAKKAGKPATTATAAAKKPEAKPKPKAAAEAPAKLAQATKPEPAPEPAAPEPEPEPTSKPKPAKPLPRIIAIATEKDDKTDKKAAKAIMLFDTHAEKIIGNKVYDIESEPRAGDEVRFETFSTSYIGASL